MILVINTADKENVFIALVGSQYIFSKKFYAKYQQAEKLLAEIDKLLAKKKCRLSNLKAIAVVSGPGTFTALRIGIATANTLAWALKIPVLAIKLSEFSEDDSLVKLVIKKAKNVRKGKIIEPLYGKEPNITNKKK